MSRIIYIGESDPVAAQLGSTLGASVMREMPGAVSDDDILFLQAYAARDGACLAALEGGNAFAACRALKARSRARVYLLVCDGDKVSPEIGRFCLADGTVSVAGGRLSEDPAQLADQLRPCRPRLSVDVLLARLERDIGDDDGKHATALRRILAAEGTGSLLESLSDPETGLYDGRFASLKLDEEFKRARRFHQPLSLLLLDVVVKGGLPKDAAARRAALAEIAGVFLNECRDIDVLSRFTETVFLFLLPGTGSDGAAVVARRMLGALRQRTFGGWTLAPVDGLASVPAAGVEDREAFLVRAEACLLLAKEGEGADGLCVDRD